MSTKMKTLTINDVTYDITDDSAVSFAVAQELTEEQKAQARANIGAASDGDVELDATLTEEKSSRCQGCW